MTTALTIPTNRITVPIAGRLYPLIAKREDTLPESLQQFPIVIYKSLPYKGDEPKPDLFRNYSESIVKLGQMQNEANQLFHMVWAAGGTFGDAVKMEAESAPPATAELYGLDRNEVELAMRANLTIASIRFALGFVHALDKMVNSQQVGAIDWTSPDACRYHYFQFKTETTQTGVRVKSEESVSGRQHTRTMNWEQDFERVRSITRHVHDLIEAKSHPVRTRIPRPERAQLVFRFVPPWLEPVARIVDGQQIRDLRIERELSREQWTESGFNVGTWEDLPPRIQEAAVFRYDPALVVGHYVLVGWNDEETKKQPAQTCDVCFGSGGNWMTGHCSACGGNGKAF